MMLKVVFVCVLFAIVYVEGATTYRKKRVIDDSDHIIQDITTSSPPTTTEIPCERRSPCGWAVYNRTTRDIEYFMRNRCMCDVGKKCVRADDDVAVTAYVYRCKEPSKKPTDTGTGTT